jgi:hypothetical protein
MRFPALVPLLAALAMAQPTVAPTARPVGPANGEALGGYNVRQSFELGYRFRVLGRGEDLYRSFVNFDPGVRLLASSLAIQSREGQGRRFDRIQLDTQGLGNDPYQNAVLRVEKNRFYRYDLRWRSNAYFVPGQTVASGSTVRNWQDQDLVLFPQRRIQFFAGFSRNTNSGAAYTALVQRGQTLPLFGPVRQRQHEYRAGLEASLAGWRWNLLHGWVNFQEEIYAQRLRSAGDRRSGPYRGNSPYWRLALFKEARLWAANGRFTYVQGQRRFFQEEFFSGSGPASPSRQSVAVGEGQRPAAAGNLNLSWLPAAKLAVTNHTALSHIRMSGSAALLELVNGAPVGSSVPFRLLGVRMIANATAVDYRPARWFGGQIGYQYSSRRIRSIQAVNVTGPQLPDEQTNGLHVLTAGVRMRTGRSWVIQADGELGRADQPVFPISGRNYQAARGRIEYRREAFRVGAFARLDYNVNSAALSSFASRSRQYGADGAWTLARGAYLDLAYAKLHLDTLGSLFYFRGASIASDQSYFVSNLHTAHVTLRMSVSNRAELSLGWSHTHDTGGRRPSAASAPFLLAAQQLPMGFTSPLGNISIRIRENLRWNAGYQYYRYGEPAHQRRLGEMRAHTGYSSVTWAF